MTKNIPQHIAIIMDGNGRWAKKRGLPMQAGHQAGSDNVSKILKACKKLGVKVVTLYAFSKENWKRSKDEIRQLFGILKYYIKKELDSFRKNRIKLVMSGDFSNIPRNLLLLIKKALNETKDFSEFIVNIAFNYGGRQEIINAIRKMLPDLIKKKIMLNEKNFSKYLYTAGLPDPDLLIRTSGERRVSNFLLWQIAYTEIYVTDVLWPDFSVAELEKAIADYKKRQRRFGARI